MKAGATRSDDVTDGRTEDPFMAVNRVAASPLSRPFDLSRSATEFAAGSEKSVVSLSQRHKGTATVSPRIKGYHVAPQVHVVHEAGVVHPRHGALFGEMAGDERVLYGYQ